MGVLTRTIPTPIPVDKLVLKGANISTSSDTYQTVLSETVPSTEFWEPWILVLCAAQGEDAAKFRVSFGGITYLSDFSPNVRVPVYLPIPDKLRMNPGDTVLVEVKSNGTTVVKAFAALTGNKGGK
jgi:hypothetical protein